jgi:hypothetical protein
MDVSSKNSIGTASRLKSGATIPFLKDFAFSTNEIIVVLKEKLLLQVSLYCSFNSSKRFYI